MVCFIEHDIHPRAGIATKWNQQKFKSTFVKEISSTLVKRKPLTTPYTDQVATSHHKFHHP